MVFSGLQATLVVNVLGSFVLGFILYEAIYAGVLAEQTQVVVGTGFLSSFTTYSTFAVQTVQTGSLNWMLLNVFATYGLGFLGVLLGRELARAVDGGDT
jgi:CrcB protein